MEDKPPNPSPEKGKPDPESVKEEIKFTSPKGRKYVIRRTTEKDAYDEDQDKT